MMDDQAEAAEHARALAARRRKVEATCTVCGASFVATPRRLFCTARCKMRAARKRWREEQESSDQ